MDSLAAISGLLLVLVLSTLPFGSIRASTTTADSHSLVRDELRSLRDNLAPQIREIQKSYAIPGLSLVVVRKNEILWLEGFGYADREAKKPVTPDTVFRAGSLAKPFTAIAIMQLVEAGEIDIDQPLVRYLPEFAIRSRFDPAAGVPTVRNVLSHHSGLPTDLNKGMWTPASFTEVAAALHDEYMAFPPKVVFSYSNMGFTLLGHIVERTSRMPYAEYMQRKVFAPWKMVNTGFDLPTHAEAQVSNGYRERKEMALLPIRDLPALGLHTTAADLGSFMTVVLGSKENSEHAVFGAGTWRMMFEPQNRDVALDLNITVGLGWFLEQASLRGATKVVRHGGTTLAYSSELIMAPEQGLGIAVLANSRDSRTIVTELAEQVLEKVLQANGTPVAPRSLRAGVDREFANVQYAETQGSYATDFGLITIREEAGSPCACFADQTFDLISFPDGSFGIAREIIPDLPTDMQILAKARFKAHIIGGREVIVATNGEQRVVLGEKAPTSSVPDTWKKRVGKYQLVNPDDGFPLIEPELKMRDGRLCMSYRMPLLSEKTIQVPLQPLSDTEAIVLGLGRTRGETLQAVAIDGQEYLRYSGFVGKKKPALEWYE